MIVNRKYVITLNLLCGWVILTACKDVASRSHALESPSIVEVPLRNQNIIHGSSGKFLTAVTLVEKYLIYFFIDFLILFVCINTST